MKTPFFLAPARAAALVLLPLAVLSLAPQSARAVSSPSSFVPKSPTFNSGNVLGSPFSLTLNGAASGVGSASLGIIGLVAGAKSYGTQAFLVNGGSAGSTGLLDPASVLNGTTTIGSINIGLAGTVIPFSADFTIPDAVNLTLNSWTLTFNFGTSSATIGGLFYNGAAAETGTLTVATTVANPTYSADLQINATQIGSGTGSFTLVIPQNSINFDGSVVDLVPEPSTWRCWASARGCGAWRCVAGPFAGGNRSRAACPILTSPKSSPDRSTRCNRPGPAPVPAPTRPSPASGP